VAKTNRWLATHIAMADQLIKRGSDEASRVDAFFAHDEVKSSYNPPLQ
jgi:hypothetical protein